MIITTTRKPNWVIALGLPGLIFLCCFLLTFTTKFKLNNQLLSNGILLDLVITAPLLYFLAIRKTTVSKSTVSRVFVMGLLLAGFILNAHNNSLLQFIKTWLAPIIESIVVFYIGRKFYVANKQAKATSKTSVDFLMHCRSVLFAVTGNEKAGNLISSEIAVLYYAFFSRRDKTIDYRTKFSNYKQNGLPMVLGFILSIFLIETISMHFLFGLWSKTIAWVLTTLSFYTCIQLYAHIKAIKARPIIINNDSFEIHNGLAGDAYIDFDNIQSIELATKQPKQPFIKICLLKGLEGHNVVVFLKQPIQVTKIFGIKKQANTVLFFVDNPKDFEKSLNSKEKK